MHEYSIDSRKTDKIVYNIAVFSVIITPFINKLLSQFFIIFEKYTAITLAATSFLVFSLLFIFFNKFLWRIFYIFFKVPNLNGIWSCKGHSYKYNTTDEYEWESELTIKQDWDKIGITQNTKNSDSFSTSIIGGIKVEDNDEVLLSYVYTNIPRSNTPELSNHEGMVKLRFTKDLKTARGDYFNDKSRQTYGIMELIKKI